MAVKEIKDMGTSYFERWNVLIYNFKLRRQANHGY